MTFRLSFCFLLCWGTTAGAFRDNSYSVGLGVYSQNALGKTTTSTNSQASLIGAQSYLLNLKYDWSFLTDWYVSPQLNYSFFPRESGGGATKTTLLHLAFPVGMNLGLGLGSPWDWFVGPGFIQYSTKGSGGTSVMSNGTGTATFALPGESAVVQNVTFETGGSYNLGASRFGFDLVFEGIASSKRSESFMLSYGYRFGGGLF